jgi:hypothetical protein
MQRLGCATRPPDNFVARAAGAALFGASGPEEGLICVSDIIEKIQKEWAVIHGAPWSFFAASVVIAGAIWFFLNQINSGTISGKDATIETLKTQNESYKEKLNGASPEEAKTRIDALEAKVAKLEPRRLYPEKLETVSKLIKTLPPMPYNLSIEADMACADCNQYAADLQSAFPQPPWSVIMPMIAGPSVRSPKGLAILTPDPKNPLPEAAAIASALTAADIPFDLMAGNDELGDPFKPSKRITALVLTTRVSR